MDSNKLQSKTTKTPFQGQEQITHDLAEAMYESFKKRCIAFFHDKLLPLGYIEYEFYNLSVQVTHPYFCFCVIRVDRNGKEICAFNLDYRPADSPKPLMLYENFEELSDIPPEYGDLRNPAIPLQAPQFVYGYFSRLGDALKSMLKGCSIDLRKPIELFY